LFDTDGDGTLSHTELLAALDKDADGKISLEEFLKILGAALGAGGGGGGSGGGDSDGGTSNTAKAKGLAKAGANSGGSNSSSNLANVLTAGDAEKEKGATERYGACFRIRIVCVLERMTSDYTYQRRLPHVLPSRKDDIRPHVDTYQRRLPHVLPSTDKPACSCL
jgi:hypothetical protein